VVEKEGELRAQILKVEQRLAAQAPPREKPAHVTVIDLTGEDDVVSASPLPKALDELASQMLQMSVGKRHKERELIVLDDE
jgi:hypothetical protein